MTFVMKVITDIAQKSFSMLANSLSYEVIPGRTSWVMNKGEFGELSHQPLLSLCKMVIYLQQ